MNSNRGQYNDSPLYNMKTPKKPPRRGSQEQATQQGQPVQGQGEAQPQGLKRHAFLSVALSFLLPVMFLVALIVQSNELRWAFLAAAALAVIAMWVLGAFVRSARNTLTVVYLALAAVIALALFINLQANGDSIAASRAQPAGITPDAAGLMEVMETATPEPTVDPAGTKSEAEKRLDGFFEAWMKNQIQVIRDYCSPAWINATVSPTNVLFQQLSGNIPVDYAIEEAGGSDGSSSRVITVRAYFPDGAEVVPKRMNVRMVKTNEVWYVVPNSLDTVPINEEEEAKAASSQVYVGNLALGSTKAPVVTDPPGTESDIKVYYNKAGKGKYSHVNRICPAVNSQWWPMEEFSFSLINSQEFKNLIPCEKCGAPARPAVSQ